MVADHSDGSQSLVVVTTLYINTLSYLLHKQGVMQVSCDPKSS